SRRPRLASSAWTAGMPPAAYRSGMWVGPAGARWHRLGVFSLISLNRARSTGQPASWAMASRCSTVLVEQ
ncbi:Helix-turn-helix domain-containing protein, partial [Dysosmobacter welbionis]